MESLNFDRLLLPFPGENPAGESLRENYSPNSSYSRIKTARETARAAERNRVWEGGEVSGPPADWGPILDLGPRILEEESKDWEIAAWLTEALVRDTGFAGLRDGFRLMRELAERFWDHLYPLPDEDGVLTRVAPLAGLNGVEADGVLLNPIANIPITLPGSFQAFTLADCQRANDLSRIADPDKRAQRITQGTATLEMLEQAVAETPADFYQTLSEDLDASIEEYEKLGRVMEEKCGTDSQGHSLAPPSSNIRNALENARDQIRSLLQGHPSGIVSEGNAAVETGGSGKPPGGSSSAGTSGGKVQTREDAFRLLLQVADFFKRTEPHSPVAYALEQAVRWGKMSLPDLWAELVPDEPTRQQLFKLVGIKLPE